MLGRACAFLRLFCIGEAPSGHLRCAVVSFLSVYATVGPLTIVRARRYPGYVSIFVSLFSRMDSSMWLCLVLLRALDSRFLWKMTAVSPRMRLTLLVKSLLEACPKPLLEACPHTLLVSRCWYSLPEACWNNALLVSAIPEACV